MRALREVALEVRGDALVSYSLRFADPVYSEKLMLLTPFPMPFFKFRPHVLTLFRQKATTKKAEVNAKLLKECNETPSLGIYNRLMQEFATSGTGGVWTLKSSPVYRAES
ncbi:hypothetical protein BDK51DRAFT_41406 [Blyttiomyces helicus]|uniref:Uncharacterized protein n=1 Tax=Blyttiomyces helicus TaxID=388810 RepID=A0A4P9W8S5_9FUNG|nr:hypothetical protein BDK51DRAFT_41406 [Blyttiomyces helicus]|eukprot:RKO86576.1 hypothetical protein BDK51DRAFT_41406 [Blyttiomyces helicus]